MLYIMQWIITDIGPEIIDGELVETRIGVGRLPKEVKALIRSEPSESRPQLVKRIAQNQEFTHEFQTFCDDGHLCYSGVCQDPGDYDESLAFGPLDYAQSDVGATEMRYRKKGEQEWHVL